MAAAPEEPALPAGSFLVLRAADGLWSKRAGPGRSAPSYGVVLCHGWMQDFHDLVATGQQLRDDLGVDVLLLDFYGHGRSPYLRAVGMHCVPALVRQLRRVLGAVGWQGRPVVIGGLSMGASVALHYAAAYPTQVRGLLMVGPSGMPESVVSLPNIGAGFAKALAGSADVALKPREPAEGGMASPSLFESEAPGLLRRLLSRLSFIRHTPSYLVDESVWAAVRSHEWPLLAYLGRYDILHTPQVDSWLSRAPWADVHVVPMTHWHLCLHAHDLGLTEQPFWDKARQYEDRVTQQPAAPTAPPSAAAGLPAPEPPRAKL